MIEQDTLQEVKNRILSRDLSHREAAREIGVTEDSLIRHMDGEYVRSDSLAKYRVWISGGADSPDTRQLDLLHEVPDPDIHDGLRHLRLCEPRPPKRAHRVVDLFCGCGGLSLGFDLAGDGRFFDTVLAIDIERAMVETLNRNHHGPGATPVARMVDLTHFINETEIRGFYLEHLCALEADAPLAEELEEIQPVGLSMIVEALRRLDRGFLRRLQEIREQAAATEAYASLDARALGQTSVVGFHASLGLPLPSSRDPDLGPLLWTGAPQREGPPEECLDNSVTMQWLHLEATIRRALERRWDSEVSQLARRAAGVARGQLASSARRIQAFLDYLVRVPGIKRTWLDWRSRRDALRFVYFENEAVARALAAAYNKERHASVVLGGPPCQGFSRIGRGKIRSLREDRVQVHYDEEAGDMRNRLFEKYVLFVEALAPSLFLFENVRHFQSEVQTPDGTFLATQVLADAVRDLSAGGLGYDVESRTILASRHGIPQGRERFFMIGVRNDLARRDEDIPLPSWTLSLPVMEELPLRVALEGLPEPFLVDGAGGGNLDRYFEEPALPGALATSAADRYRAWVRRPHPIRGASGREAVAVDAHVARNHRSDDRAWFALMGPGKRWMDYRCDGSPTLARLQATLSKATGYLQENADPEQAELCSELVHLQDELDGSLSLRLLLEKIDSLPGEPGHHLLKSTYLRKREGNHGDWLARLDPERPARTIVTHMGKDTYAYVHPSRDRTLSVREAARIQTFPDWFSFGSLGLVDGFRVIGNAVPPLLSCLFAERVAQLLDHAAPTGLAERALAG